jgi:hypothetical protein
MLKSITLLLLCQCLFTIAHSQLCPGGGTNFSNAVFFDQSYVSACASGTSCTGGTIFDNRAACEPTTAMDACAPTPTCGTAANMGSDIWFKFYATGTSATINIIQNISFVASIQAFSGTPACGNLTQIGCIIAGGPSGGVTLNLTGLTQGALYHFRVFGTANSASQRTGTFCFCGTSGLSATVLPVRIVSLAAAYRQGRVELNWVADAGADISHFMVERSNGSGNFAQLGKVTGKAGLAAYSYIDNIAQGGSTYRLKMVDRAGGFAYSGIVAIRNAATTNLSVQQQAGGWLLASCASAGNLTVYGTTGKLLFSAVVKKGANLLPANLAGGIYIAKNGQDVCRFFISKL